MGSTIVTFTKRLGTDKKNLVVRVPDDCKDAANMEVGDYYEIRMRLIKRRADELREEGATEAQVQENLDKYRPKKKVKQEGLAIA